MDFLKARKEFEMAKRACVNGAISLDELQTMVDCDLEVTDKQGKLWKIDEESGEWLRYDETAELWEEAEPEVTDKQQTNSEETEFTIKIKPPVSPKAPEPSQAKNDQHVTVDEKTTGITCQNCHKSNNADCMFCTGCGKSLEEKNRCTNCGKSLKEGNSFCTGCGHKAL